MKQFDRILKSPLRDALIFVLLTLFGLFFQPVLELIAPPLFSPQNLPSIAFIIAAIFSVISVSLWRASQKSTQLIAERLDYIAGELGQDANLVPYDAAYRQLTEWANSAQEDIRILTYYPRPPKTSEIYDFHSPRMRSSERAKWFEAANRAIERTETTKLRFIRVIQVSNGKMETDPTPQEIKTVIASISSDASNRDQLDQLLRLNVSAADRACLKFSRVYMTNSFVLIDGKHLFMDIDIWDPNDSEFKTPFVLMASDTTGKRFEELRRRHERINLQTPIYYSVP